jgi:hypothetical protein
MSEPILPLRQWPAGIQQASVPANDNALRLEALSRPALGVANDAAGGDADGDVWVVGSTPVGAFAAFDANDVALYHVDPVSSVGGWHAWAPVEGLRLVVNDVRKVFDGADWIDDPSITGGGGGAVSSVNGATGAVIIPVPIIIACSDETTALTTGAAKATFRMPYAMTLTAVRASLTTAQPSGSIFTVDINEAGATILSTKLTIDNTEKTSTTAATPAVISDTSLANDAEITIDIDQIGASGAAGLKVYLIGYPT